MDKTLLAHMLVFYASDSKKKHDFSCITAREEPYLTAEQNIKLSTCIATKSAGAKIIKGKIEYGAEYLVSYGETLGFGLEPDVVCEYNRHWPYDYCYMYKI